MLKKMTIAVLAFAFLALAVRPAMAEDDLMQNTFQNAMYGGLIGALVGAGVYLVSDNQDWDDHISYIPTGAGVGILVGTAYGLAKGTVIKTAAAAEVKDGKVSFNMPTVKTTEVYDTYTHKYEVVESVDLLKVKF